MHDRVRRSAPGRLSVLKHPQTIRRWRRQGGAAFLVALAWACSPQERDPGEAGPPLELVDSTRLAEADSLYVGRPTSLALDPQDGSLYVGDAFAERVIRFGRNGEPVRVYGSRGEGPGEFRGVGQILVMNSDVVVADVYHKVLNVFDRNTGEFRRSRSVEALLKRGVRDDGVVWIGAQNPERNTGVVRWDLRADTLDYVVARPREYTESPHLAGIFTGASVAPWSDTLLVGFSGSNKLFLTSESGEVLDTIDIPTRRRRGVPDDVVRRLDEVSSSFPEMFSLISALFHMHRLPNGDFALVHHDQEIDGRLITADVYVSLLSRDRTRACVDIPVPVSKDAQPIPAFRGDTLFVMEQRVEEQSTSTIVKAYRIRGTSCEWEWATI